MAKEKSGWDRFRQRQDEEEKKATAEKDPESLAPDSSNLDLLLKDATLLIDQIQSLYQMYVSGQEKMPPLSQVKRLETLTLQIDRTPKINASQKFKAQQFSAKKNVFAERWKKLALKQVGPRSK